MKNRLSIFLVLLLPIYLVGCSTMKTINVPQNPQELSNKVKIGDQIEVITTDKKTHAFTVTKLDKKALYGHDQKVPYQQVAHIEKKTLDKKSVAIGTGGLVGGLVIATGIILATCVVII